MSELERFAEFTERNVPLAPFTQWRVGGPAEFLVRPRSLAELGDVVRHAFASRSPFHVLGGGSHLLVPDEGVKGIVLRLSEPAFGKIEVEGRRLRAGAGAALSALISEAAQHALAGLEVLVGIPGTIGGALRTNAGDRASSIGPFVQSVQVVDSQGRVHLRDRDDLRFGDDESNLDDPVLLAADFLLESDQTDAIVRRMRKAWIQRKAARPPSYQAAVRVFRNPRGLSATTLLEQVGLAKMRVGNAEFSDRDPNFLVAHPGATSRDILRLINMARSKVRERFQIELELAITLW